MFIIGCDLHTRYQQIAMRDTAAGAMVTRRLEPEKGEARAFYASLRGPVRVGIEATYLAMSQGRVGRGSWGRCGALKDLINNPRIYRLDRTEPLCILTSSVIWLNY